MQSPLLLLLIISESNDQMPYSAKIWIGEILVDLPATTKILPSKCITEHPALCSTAKILPFRYIFKLHPSEITPSTFCTIVLISNFVVYKFSWISWYSLIHENLYTMKINTYHTRQRLYLPCRHGHKN